jgi:hypothetical protein
LGGYSPRERVVHSELNQRVYTVFQADVAAAPRMTLRGGYAADSYAVAPPYDPTVDEPTDDYLEAYTFWGLAYLDAASWRHYLPRLIDYALRHPDDPRMAVESLLHNLRPPDREPPRLGSLTPDQEAVIVAFIEQIAFHDDSANQDLALQVLEEWWLPNALYRRHPELST